MSENAAYATHTSPRDRDGALSLTLKKLTRHPLFMHSLMNTYMASVFSLLGDALIIVPAMNIVIRDSVVSGDFCAGL